MILTRKHLSRKIAAGGAMLMLGAYASQAASYRIEPVPGARFALQVYKTGLMRGKKHLFLFPRYHGELVYDAQQPTASRMRLVIESASAECRDTWVSAKSLKKIQKYALEKMLAAKQYPEIVFASRRIRAQSDTEFTVEGTLTIRGIAKPVTVRVTLKPGSQQRLSFDGKAVVKMKDYGLKPPRAALGTIGTKNEMDVSFQLIAVPAN